jgi:hypothetical protein
VAFRRWAGSKASLNATHTAAIDSEMLRFMRLSMPLANDAARGICRWRPKFELSGLREGFLSSLLILIMGQTGLSSGFRQKTEGVAQRQLFVVVP